MSRLGLIKRKINMNKLIRFYLIAGGEPTACVPARSAKAAYDIMWKCGFILNDSKLGPLEMWQEIMTIEKKKLFDIII
jgi:hypothetical protein